MTQRKAFTLVELMVAIGIIVVLIGLATVGLRYATSQSQANATKVALENLKSMMAELELATKFRTPPAVWYRYTPSDGLWHTCTPATFAGGVDFYRTIDVVTETLNRDSTNPARYTFAPGLVTEDGRVALTEREQTALLNTIIFMDRLRTLPVNKSAMDRLPPETLLQMTALAGKAGDPALVPFSAQVVADGWRNPIIFVPGTPAYTGATGTDPAKGLLLGRPYDNATKYQPGQYVLTGSNSATPLSFKCVATTQGNTPPNAAYWEPAPVIVAPNNRPFFASAGPDGDFSRGDDNIYSFEQ